MMAPQQNAAAANPTAGDVELELRRVRAKLEAGCHLLMTQPVYELEAVARFFERLGPIEVPVLAGVLPLMSSRHAAFIHNELAGVEVPDAARARLRGAVRGCTRRRAENERRQWRGRIWPAGSDRPGEGPRRRHGHPR